MKTPNGRIELPDYPESAINEVLVNALIHRDYTIISTEIHVDIYDDRIQIYSPGGMVEGSPIQALDIENISSKRRNPIIADAFSRIKLIERRGSGLRKIIDSYKNSPRYNENKMPIFFSNNDEFHVILKNLNYRRLAEDTIDII